MTSNAVQYVAHKLIYTYSTIYEQYSSYVYIYS